MNTAQYNKVPLPEDRVSPENGQVAEPLNTSSTAAQSVQLGLGQQQDLLRTLIDNLPDYVYIKNADGRFIIANLAVARQLGFASADEVIGKSDFDLFP